MKTVTHNVVEICKYTGENFSPVFVTDCPDGLCDWLGCPELATRGRRTGKRFCETHYKKWSAFLNRMSQRRWFNARKTSK